MMEMVNYDNNCNNRQEAVKLLCIRNQGHPIIMSDSIQILKKLIFS